MIEEVGTELRRGGFARVYRAQRRPMLTDEEFELLPLPVRRAIRAIGLREVVEHVASASRDGGFDSPDAHVSWTPFELDEQGYADMVALADEVLKRALEIQTQATNRGAARQPRELFRTELVLLHFLRGAEPDRQDEGIEATPLSRAQRERAYALSEDIEREIVGEEPDWSHVWHLLDELSACVRPFVAGS
jgi:hypothetical protein